MESILTVRDLRLKHDMETELGFVVNDPNMLTYNYSNETPLMLVNFTDDPLNYTKLLIKMGADPNFTDEEEGTVLHYAVANENPDTIKYLLSVGANPFIRDGQGETPYDFANRLNHIIEAHILKDHMLRKIQNKTRRYLTHKRRKKAYRRLALAKSMESQQGPFSSIRYDPSLMEKITEFM